MLKRLLKRQRAAPKPVIEIPRLITGRPMTAASFLAMAEGDECAGKPLVIDNRGADDPSYSILPKLEPGDFDRAQAWAGFQVSDLYGCRRASPGQKYLDLYAIEIKCGPAVLQPTVLNEDGLPQEGVLLFLYWPDAEQFPAPVDPPLHQNGVGGFTNADGNVGWGIGPGSQITPGEGGPFDIWASSGTGPLGTFVGSDAFIGAGWFDNHCMAFNPWFRVRTKSGALPTGDYRLVDFDADGNVVGVLPLQDGAPPASMGRLSLFAGDEEVGFMPWQAP